jgi:hypothetical protein
MPTNDLAEINLDDDVALTFGTTTKFKALYKSAATRFEIQDAGGNCMCYVTDDGTTGTLGFPTGSKLVSASSIINNQSLLNNYSTAAQTPAAATRTYITGSKITVPTGKLQIGTMFRWTFDMTKTAAGTASSTFDICVGTAGTTADTARVSFTKPAGTAAVDCGRVVIDCVCRGPLSGSGVFAGHFNMTHNLSATGHATIPVVDVTTISGAFDVTVANLFVGVCITSGASDAITIDQCKAECWNM